MGKVSLKWKRTPNISMRLAVPIILMSIWSYGFPSLCRAQAAEWKKGHISTALYNPEKGSFWKQTGVVTNVETSLVDAQKGESFDGLLRSNGILPNADAYGLIYELNPNVKDLSSINLGGAGPAVKLLLPRATGNEAFQSALKAGFLVEITTDKKLKQELLGTIGRTGENIKTVLNDSAAGAGPVATQLNQVTDNLRVVKAVIEQKARPLSTAILQQVLGETVELGTLLQSVIKSKRRLSDADIAAIKLFQSDISQQMSTFDEVYQIGKPHRKWKDVTVFVKVLDNGQDTAEPWRVFYATPSLIKKSAYWLRFGSLTPARVDTMPEAEYCFWVGTDDKPAPPPAPFCKFVGVPADGVSLFSIELRRP